MGQYMKWLAHNRGLAFDSYAQLWEWSVTDLEGFWASIWDFFDVRAQTPYEGVLTKATMPGAVWFRGATLNYAEHALRTTGDRVMVVSVSQTRFTVELSAAELRDQVTRVRAGLVRLGVARGDRVAAYLPNGAEAVVAFLAAASLGAIWSSCAPESGARSAIDRLRQIEPAVLLAIDGYCSGSDAVDRTADVAAIRAALPSLRSTVVLPYLHEDPSRIPGALPWSELVATGSDLVFEPVPFDHPLYVLFSSGTTGLPKPIVHRHGGMLLEQLKALGLHHDLGEQDRFFWFSSTGWMMWNHLVSALAVGASIVCFDGSPTHPDLNNLWQLAAQTETTYFGAGAPFFMACRREALSPRRQFDLSRLRGIGSTASPLPPEGFRWVSEAVGPHVQLASMSGGTDVCTALVGGNPLLPVRAGEISCRYLGARVEAYDPVGRPVVGEQGEMVITAPMPSMPVGFWGDDDGSRYRASYFDKYPGVWCHGDWITINDRGGCVITGRSDATLNRGGLRVGTAEVYAVVEAFAEVEDSLIVHIEGEAAGDPGELRLFVVPTHGNQITSELRLKMASELGRQLSPGHVPDRIETVAGIPRTQSGKKLEVPVKRLLQGARAEEVSSRDAVANPEALDAFAALARNGTHDGPEPRPAPQQPRSKLMESVARIWARSLSVDRVGPNDDFFDLGGTSLRALRMLARVEHELGVSVPLAVFLNGGGTVAGMVSVIDATGIGSSNHRFAVPIRIAGTSPALFFVHPGEAAMLTMRHFMRVLGDDQRVMGLLPEQPRSRSDPGSIEELAATMVATIRATQTCGPYYVGGYSLGGVLAYEVASQLRARREEVAWLAVLDAVTPVLSRRTVRRRGSVRERLRRQRERGLHGSLRKGQEAVLREVNSALVRLRIRPGLDYVKLASAYACPGNDAPMELFVTADGQSHSGSDSLGWEHVHRGSLRIHEVPGGHGSMVTEPYVHVLATMLAQSLQDAQHTALRSTGNAPIDGTR